MRALAISLVSLAIGPAAAALAEPPNVTLESPANGSVSNDRTPSFAGSTDDLFDEVTLEIYAGTTTEASARVQTLGMSLPMSGAWSAGPAETLEDGIYTAQASQTNVLTETGRSEPPVTFRVDTSSPTVTLQAPESPSNNTAPTFSGFASDSSPVTVQVFAGSSTKGSVVATATANHTGGDWTSDEASPALPAGEYTAVAIQESSLGNPPGESAPVSFVIETAAPRVTLVRPSSPSNDTTPSFTGTASDTRSVLVQIHQGSTPGGAVVSSAAATGTGGGWTSGNASPALASGEYTAVASQESSLGNPTGTSSPVTFTVDTASPTVTLQQPPTPSNKTKPSFIGTASDGTSVVVHIYNAGNSEVASASANGTGGAWTANNENNLASGSYTAVATQASSLGNPPGSSEPVGFTVETAPPKVTLSSPAVRSNDTSPSFTGTASDTTPVKVQIYAGASASGSIVSTATATATGAGGSWTSGSASPSLANGEYTAVAKQESSLGNPPGTSSPVTFTVDTRSPTVTLAQPPSPSNITHPSFTGTASEATPITVRIYAGASAKGTVVATATAAGTGGSWTSGASSSALASGQYTATATQESSLGNPAGVSAPATFTVNTSSPTVTLAQPKSPSNNTVPSFTGTASDTTTVTVDIYAGATPGGSVVSTATATGTGGSWSSTSASPGLASGTYSAVAVQPSSLGNPSGSSPPVTFKVDTTSPVVTLAQPGSPSNNVAPTFTGAASDSTAVVVRVFDSKGLEVASAEATPHGGAWTTPALSPALSSGKNSYTAVAAQASSLGNPAGTSSTVAFTVDTTPPTVTLNQPVSHSNDATPSFSGTASDTSPVTVQVYSGTSTKGSLLRTVTTPGTGGSWTSPEVTPPLPSGKHTYTAVATQTSSLGNPTGTSSSVTFTVDTDAPTVTMDAPASPSNNSTPSFTGTTDEATTAVVVRIFDESDSEVASAAAPATIGRWTSAGATPALPDGTYTAEAMQESLFGNHVGESRSFAFRIDTAAPAVNLTSPADGASTSGSSQLVQGSAGTAVGDQPAVTVQLFAGSAIAPGQGPLQSIQVAAGGVWSATFAGLGAGAYVVRAEQSDTAGNLGISPTRTFSLGATTASVHGPPAASFSWSPITPHPGEKVSLLSSSTDASSPITAYAWDLSGTGAFAAGGAVQSTTFSAAGKHLVQLRVTDANGASSVASETITVTAARVPLMQPFPTVRIASSRSGAGIRLRLLSVRAAAGARISVKCSGRGCPLASQSRVAAAGKVGVAPVEFRRFERQLRPGVVLEIRIAKAGMIGKYTRFTVRRGRLPLRSDACLGSAAPKPIACPSS